MKKRAFTPFDASDYLKTEKDVAAYLAAASEDGDPKVLVSAIGDVIRARNVSKIARDAGLTREGVYKAFSVGGNPSFATVMKVADALQLDLAFQARGRRAKERSHAAKTGRTPSKPKTGSSSSRVAKAPGAALSRR